MSEENIEIIENEDVNVEIKENEENISENNGKVKVEIKLGNLVSVVTLFCSLIVLIALIISFIN